MLRLLTTCIIISCLSSTKSNSQECYSLEIEDDDFGFVLFQHYDEVSNSLFIGQSNEVIKVDSNHEVSSKDFSYALLGPTYSKINNAFYLSAYSNDLKSRIVINTTEEFDTIKTIKTPSRLDTALYFGHSFIVGVMDKVVEFATLQDRRLTSGDYIWLPEWIVYDTLLNSVGTLEFPENKEILALNAKVFNDTLYVPYKEILKEQPTTFISNYGLLKYNLNLELIKDVFLFEGWRLDYEVFDCVIMDNGSILHDEPTLSHSRLTLQTHDGETMFTNKEVENWFSTDSPEIKSMLKIEDGILLTGKISQSSVWRRRTKPFRYDAGWIAKVDFTGEMIWQHHYSNKKEDNTYLNSVFNTSSILENGDILVSGHVKDRLNQLSKRTWTLRLSPEGCLNDTYCDYDIHILEDKEVVDTCEFIFENPVWSYRQYDPRICTFKFDVKVISDTLIGHQLSSVFGAFREDTLIQGSELIVSKEVGRVHFFENNKWWMMHDFSYGIEYADTLEFFIPKNAWFYSPNELEKNIIEGYTGPYYAFVDGGGVYIPDDTTYIRGFIFNDVTNEFVAGDYSEVSYEKSWDYVGPESSLFGRRLGMVHENFCGAPLVCFKNNRFEQEFIEGGCDFVTSIENRPLHKDVAIYPNPTLHNLNIASDLKFSSYKLLDLNGRQVMDGPYSSKIDLDNLTSGFYIIELMNRENYVRKPFIKQ